MVCKKCGYRLDNHAKNCSSCGYDNSLSTESKKRKTWFTVFLYVMIGINIILIINYVGVLIQNDNGYGHELTYAMIIFALTKIVLGVIEIFIYTLLFKMKKKTLNIYYIFLIVCSIVNILTFDVAPFIFKYIPVYLIFRSQQDNFVNTY